MFSYELRTKFLNFFKQKDHKILPSFSLIPRDDPSVLLTTAGMQQFKGWFSGIETPKYLRVATCQKCVRTSDIEEVGDKTHLTFFEMLGNFSFGNYWKKEAITWSLEFLTKELKINRKRISATIFRGDKGVSRDNESYKILKNLNFDDDEIKERNRQDNFWGPTGSEGPCGPTVEFYVDEVEVWNLVFNEYYKTNPKSQILNSKQIQNSKFKIQKLRNKSLIPLKQKGVDTGMGLERVLAILNNKKSVYETDLFESLIFNLKSKILNLKSIRIICDHVKAAVFLISDGVVPLNIEQGYVLRRLIRRAIRHLYLLDIKKENILLELAKNVIEIYQKIYSELSQNKNKIFKELNKEQEKFGKTLGRGLREFEKIYKSLIINHQSLINGVAVFHLYDTYGFPLELTRELANEKNMKIDEAGFWQEFKRHQQISRAGMTKKFKGGLAEQNLKTTKLHTATHLLHQALRQILGNHIKQMGSNITSERLRFDFSHPKKLTFDEIKKVENLVNQKIKEKLKVDFSEMPYQKAIKEGAFAFFKEKYPEVVRVYNIGNFSKEICRGPHVKTTSELGHFKITKEESSSAGVRRIKAVIEQ
ncbi:MAG: alanine--tRNA ligase [Patescibacteria group bacterium]